MRDTDAPQPLKARQLFVDGAVLQADKPNTLDLEDRLKLVQIKGTACPTRLDQPAAPGNPDLQSRPQGFEPCAPTLDLRRIWCEVALMVRKVRRMLAEE